MDFLEIITEIVVCILAVYGIYAILCRILAHGCYKGDLSIALHADRQADLLSDAGARRATLLTEAQNGKMRSPVILVDGETDENMLHILAESGYDLYRKMDEK